MRLNRDQAEASQSALRLLLSEQQVNALQEADRIRRDLLANVSHELRTPLGTILNESTDIASSMSGADASRRLSTIASEARRLRTLVDDMLDMARIEGGALDLNLEPTNIGDAIGAAIERLHRQSPNREVKVEPASAEVPVLADWGRLGQILDNLLANADRFAPAGTPIEIRISGREPGLVTVEVVDHGPGISPEVRAHAFERFVRGHGHAPGTGLGLAIVKGLVEAHAGTVRILDPQPGLGAVIQLTLPEAGRQ